MTCSIGSIVRTSQDERCRTHSSMQRTHRKREYTVHASSTRTGYSRSQHSKNKCTPSRSSVGAFGFCACIKRWHASYALEPVFLPPSHWSVPFQP